MFGGFLSGEGRKERGKEKVEVIAHARASRAEPNREKREVRRLKVTLAPVEAGSLTVHWPTLPLSFRPLAARSSPPPSLIKGECSRPAAAAAASGAGRRRRRRPGPRRRCSSEGEDGCWARRARAHDHDNDDRSSTSTSSSGLLPRFDHLLAFSSAPAAALVEVVRRRRRFYGCPFSPSNNAGRRRRRA